MYIKVKVLSGARKESIEKVRDNEYRISVKEPAERNMANKRVIELLSIEFGVQEGVVRLINGHHSPSKLFSIMI